MISVVRSIQYHYAGCPAHCILKNNLGSSTGPHGKLCDLPFFEKEDS